MSTYTVVTNCQKQSGFFGPPCISVTYISSNPAQQQTYVKCAWSLTVAHHTHGVFPQWSETAMPAIAEATQLHNPAQKTHTVL